MLTIILGFATSLVYGFADFFGAIGSRKIKPVTVTMVSGFVGLIFVCLVGLSMGASFSSGVWFWGTIAGLSSAVGLSALYAALAIGPISILSPLSAVVSAIVPMLVGFFIGERFSALGFVALGVILLAVFLVGFVPGDDVHLPTPRALILSIVAGTGIGVVLIAIDQAPGDSGLGPVIIVRAVAALSLALFLVLSLVRKSTDTPKPAPAKRFWLAVALAGIFDGSANILFLLASREGSLTVVAVLTALYPLGTIILARIFLKERLAKSQMAGILLALGGSALLAIA
ncbi:EamA family transporter [Rhodoluna sp.]|uniref:DMT family transporter n=1 Tax=Rhodoluna sp. TaxID=1969481 RepID=UPI0026004100|nr:EamA family transporter [Rhodoluna sp.]